MNRYEKEIIYSLRQLKDAVRPSSSLSEEEKVFSYFRENFSHPRAGFDFYLYLKPAAVSLMVFLFIALSGWGVVFAARNTIPGDLLYPVKRAAEKTRIALSVNPMQKSVLRAEILAVRLEEAQVLQEKADQGPERADHLNLIARDVSRELDNLKQEIIAQQGEGEETIFSDEQLLEGKVVRDAALPIKDGRQAPALEQTENLKRILQETRQLLAEKNLQFALEKIKSAEEIIKAPTDQFKEPEKVEEEVSQPEAEQESAEKEPIIKEPVEQPVDIEESEPEIVPAEENESVEEIPAQNVYLNIQRSEPESTVNVQIRREE